MPEARVTETVDAALPHRGVVRLEKGAIITGDIAAFLLTGGAPFVELIEHEHGESLAVALAHDAAKEAAKLALEAEEKARAAADTAGDADAKAAIDAVAEKARAAVAAAVPSPADLAKPKA